MSDRATEHSPSGRLFVEKAAVKDFYESNLPPGIEDLFGRLNDHLKDKFGSEFISLIPLGSLRGGWALRKSLGLTPYYRDIDCGMIIDVPREIKRNSNELPYMVNAEVAKFLGLEAKDNEEVDRSALKLCNRINPQDIFFNIGYMNDYEIKYAFSWANHYEAQRQKGDYDEMEMNVLVLPFLYGDKKIIDKVNSELANTYPNEKLEIIYGAINHFTKQVLPKYVHTGVESVEQAKRTGRRLSALKEVYLKGNEKNS